MELNNSKNVARKNGITILTHGAPGVGKTYIIRTLPNPVVLAAEPGMLSLRDTDTPYISIDEPDDLKDAFSWLKNEGYEKFDSAALDSVSKMAKMILSEEQDRHRDGRQAYGETNSRVRDLFDSFTSLPMHVYFSAKQASWDENGQTVYGPAFPGKQLTRSEPVAHQFDNVFAMVLDDESDPPERQLLTQSSDGYQAKVRDPEDAIDPIESPDLGDICERLID